MKKVFTRCLLILVLILCATLAVAGEAPLLLVHELTGFSQDDSAVTVDYRLHVENRGDTAVTEVTLSLVPVIPVLGQGTTAQIAYLGAHEAADLPLRVESKLQVPKSRYAGAPLFLMGRCVDSEGKIVEFPVRSKPGGAQ